MQTSKLWMDTIEQELEEETKIQQAYARYCGQIRLEDIFTTDTVYIAAQRCACGFRNRSDTQAFLQSVWVNSRDLRQRVLNGTFRPRYYKKRIIMERGKKREIQPPVFECKVVQKVLCDFLVRCILERRMIRHNYASIHGRGTKLLYEDVLKGLNEAGRKYQHPVIVMTDFSNFFASIDTAYLREKIFSRYIADERIVDLIMLFSPEPYGLSLGNELSQVPASFYPSAIDHAMKDRLGIRYYYRYMDDILFVVDGKADAEAAIDLMTEIGEPMNLRIKAEKLSVFPYGKWFIYCKERFLFNKEHGYYYQVINPDIPRQERHKIRAFGEKCRNGEMTVVQAETQYRGVRGVIAGHPNTRKKVAEMDALYTEIFGAEAFEALAGK